MDGEEGKNVLCFFRLNTEYVCNLNLEKQTNNQTKKHILLGTLSFDSSPRQIEQVISRNRNIVHTS